MKYQSLGYKEIEAVVHEGETVPAGMTRFNISGRCLNLQVSLVLLKQDDDVEQLCSWKQFLANKLANTRCYTEKVYLVEQQFYCDVEGNMTIQCIDSENIIEQYSVENF